MVTFEKQFPVSQISKTLPQIGDVMQALGKQTILFCSPACSHLIWQSLPIASRADPAHCYIMLAHNCHTKISLSEIIFLIFVS